MNLKLIFQVLFMVIFFSKLLLAMPASFEPQDSVIIRIHSVTYGGNEDDFRFIEDAYLKAKPNGYYFYRESSAISGFYHLGQPELVHNNIELHFKMIDLIKSIGKNINDFKNPAGNLSVLNPINFSIDLMDADSSVFETIPRVMDCFLIGCLDTKEYGYQYGDDLMTTFTVDFNQLKRGQFQELTITQKDGNYIDSYQILLGVFSKSQVKQIDATLELLKTTDLKIINMELQKYLAE